MRTAPCRRGVCGGGAVGGARTFNIVDFPVLEGGRVLGVVAVAARERVVAALRPDVGVESEPGGMYLII